MITGDRALATKNRAAWASGDYSSVATELFASLGPALVGAVRIRPGDYVLDVAAGSGNAAIAAAEVGARVVASDLTPELRQRGQTIAAERGVSLSWRQADAEALPFTDSEFDAVISCVGVMFAPHHQRAADELVRVCKAGGRIGLVSWTPEGFFGQMLAMLNATLRTPLPEVQAPPLWGRKNYVRQLLGERVGDLVVRRRMLTVDRFASGAKFRHFVKAYFGPAITVYRNIVGDPERIWALDAELAILSQHYLADAAMQWEYLLVTARKR